ncbi:hypothetical protein [Rhodococcus pyridinivorans]|nr:hypothetical protein [Rhodococcus pyridinivorans]
MGAASVWEPSAPAWAVEAMLASNKPRKATSTTATTTTLLPNDRNPWRLC